MLYENDILRRGYWANDNTKHFLVVLIYDGLVTIRPSLVCEYLTIGSVIYCLLLLLQPSGHSRNINISIVDHLRGLHILSPPSF